LFSGNDQQYNGTHHIDKEDKSHQWFGATVQSSGVNGITLVSLHKIYATVFWFSELDSLTWKTRV
jgi:hypothetical protein